jgi:hypothetical protein
MAKEKSDNDNQQVTLQSTVKSSIQKVIDYIIARNERPDKSTVTNLINLSYLLVKLVDSIELITKQGKPNDHSLRQLESIVSDLLVTTGVIVPVMRMVLPDTRFSTAMIVLAYNLALFRKALVVASHGTVGQYFKSLVVPTLNALRVPGATYLSSRL